MVVALCLLMDMVNVNMKMVNEKHVLLNGTLEFCKRGGKNLNILGWLGFTCRLSNMRLYGLPFGLNGDLTLSYVYKLN